MSVDDAGRTLERCLVEIEHLRATCHSTGEIKSLEGRLKAANDLLNVYKQEAARLNDAMQSRTGVNAARIADYEKRIKAFEVRLLSNEAEFKKLKSDTSRMRKGRNVAIGIAIGLAVSLGWALSR